MNPVTDDVVFQFQVNATDGADYNDSQITSTFFLSSHTENDSDASIAYVTGADQALGTAFQRLCKIGNGSDESAAGELFLFNPSSTTYVKNFYSRCVEYHAADTIQDTFVAGYINDATAIDDIQFKMSSGNMDGTIKMYGVG